MYLSVVIFVSVESKDDGFRWFSFEGCFYAYMIYYTYITDVITLFKALSCWMFQTKLFTPLILHQDSLGGYRH